MLCYAFRPLSFVLKFPHEVKIVTIDQLSFFTSSSENKVLYVDQIPTPYDIVGSGLFKDPSLMGIFPLSPPKNVEINMISQSNDPWIIP